MSSSTTSVTAYTKQSDPVPKPGSGNAPVPEELWIVLILFFITSRLAGDRRNGGRLGQLGQRRKLVCAIVSGVALRELPGREALNANEEHTTRHVGRGRTADG